jgi:hypothetical protein
VHPTEQTVTHVPAYQVQLVPGTPKSLAETRERFRDLQVFYVGHHHA